MKYGYHFMDWGLFDIDEIEEIFELTEDLIIKDSFGTHIFNKENWVLVKTVKDIFIGNHSQKNIGPYYKEYIFDTYEEAEAYGNEHSYFSWL